MKQSSFDAETSALDVETSAFGAATSAISRRSFDATISALDPETIARSYRRLRSWYVPAQVCNRVSNHGDMSTFSKPGLGVAQRLASTPALSPIGDCQSPQG